MMLILLLSVTELTLCIWDLYESDFIYYQGSFINSGPCACFMACTIPCLILLFRSVKSRIIKVAIEVICVLYSILIPLSLSRTAIITAVIGVCICFLPNIRSYIITKNIRREYLVGVLLLIIVAIGFLVLAKFDSAYGRLLIWKIAVCLIPEIPITGVGWDFIESTYNVAQESYFQSHIVSVEDVKVADSTNYLFNEYLSCIIAYGIVGAILVFGCIGSFMYIAKRYYQWELLGAIVSFALTMGTSYPLHCLQTVLLAALVSLMTIKFITWQMVRLLMSILFLFVFSFMFYNAFPRDYETPFRAAVVLHEHKRYQESNKILCGYLEPRVADVRILYLIGRNFQKMHQSDLAEKYYKRSMLRVPSRHYPHYLLMKLYRETGQDSLAQQEAICILVKEPKVLTKAIEEMRYEAALYLHTHGRD